MMQALQDKTLTGYGDGSQTRSLGYGSDLVEGLSRLLLSGETGPINIGSPEEVSVLQLANEIVELTESNSPIVFELLPVDAPRRRRPDITRAMAALAWHLRVSRREGIPRVIPYFQTQLEAQCAR